ncbi:hypothetical protein CDD83_294 [Cordyceps sp. RAO-2017]|nr:hypothetical protein CDD83_294 [Cordyceps sp. RAO-2017]
MGKPFSMPVKGCAMLQTVGDLTVFEFWKAVGMFVQSVDCDCQTLHECPFGEPTMPPLHEFLEEVIPQNGYYACPGLRKPPPIPQRNTWLEQPADYSDKFLETWGS